MNAIRRMLRVRTVILLALAASQPALAGTTYYVSQSSGDDSRDGLATEWDGAHGPWKSLARASAVEYLPGDQLLLKCGDIWDETLRLSSSGTPEAPITVAAYGEGERPYIRRTLGKSQSCILVRNAAGYHFRDLELGYALCGIHLWLDANAKADYNFYRFEDCFFHDIGNPKFPGQGESSGWALLWWGGHGVPRNISVQNCVGLRTQAFFNGGSKGNVLFSRNTITHGSMNQVYQSEAGDFDIDRCVFVYNYPWLSDGKGATQVIAGHLDGGPDIRYDVRNNEFGWGGDYPGAPDGCGYDFEVPTNGVIFQNNLIHDSYGEAVLFMAGCEHKNLLFDGNVFRDNVRFSPKWDCTISLPPSVTGSGTFSNNKFYLWPGKRAFSSNPACFRYVGNDEQPTQAFVAMPVVTHIDYREGARTYTLACATPGATIRYTTFGGIPLESSEVYSGPITIKRSGVLNVKAFKKGCHPSYVNSLAVEMREPEGREPIAWWKLDEPAGRAVLDTCGKSGGMLTGAARTAGRTGRGLEFGGNALVAFRCAALAAVSDTFTVAFWAAPAAARAVTPESGSGLIAAGAGALPFALGPIGRGGAGGPEHAGMGVLVGTNGVSVCEASDAYLPTPLVTHHPLAGWNHVAVVYRDRQPTLYLNGIFEKAGCRSEKSVHPVFNLGGSDQGWYRGKLDDVRVYDRALSDAEIQELSGASGESG